MTTALTTPEMLEARVADAVSGAATFGEARINVRNAVIAVAKQSERSGDVKLANYLNQHADCYCREVFCGYDRKQKIASPDELKVQVLKGLPEIFKTVYNGS